MGLLWLLRSAKHNCTTGNPHYSLFCLRYCSREIDKRKIRTFGFLLLSIVLILGVGLSSYFLIDSFRSGLLFKLYLWIGLGINAITAISITIIIIRLWTWESNTHFQENEDFFESEFHSLVAIFLLALIPGLHILFLPRVIANAKNIFEYAANSSQNMRYYKAANNLIAVSVLIFMIYTLAIGLFLIVAGDTRKL